MPLKIGDKVIAERTGESGKIIGEAYWHIDNTECYIVKLENTKQNPFQFYGEEELTPCP